MGLEGCGGACSAAYTAKVEQTMQGVIVLELGAVRPRIPYRMLFERGLRDQHLRFSLHRILGTVF